MARSARLKLALLGAGVVLGHLVALEWLGRQADAISALQAMAPPMLTRLLQPAKPPPVAVLAPAPAPPKAARAALPPQQPASAAKEAMAPEQQAREEGQPPAAPPAEPAAEAPVAQAEPIAEPAVAQAESIAEPAVAQAEPVAQPPGTAASAPASAFLDRWPVDSRLNYDVTGHWRGPLYGNARVLWQRVDSKYQVRLDVDLGLVSQVLTSQGEVTPQGLLPHVYEEQRPGKRRIARIGDQVVTLESGRTLPKPDGVQDTASQFVELSQRFATGQEQLEVGRTVSVWLARPGGVDHWTYDIVEREMLRVPRMGEVEAFRLVPRPIARPRGNYTAEMWFAPSLQYLPVRIRVHMGTDAWLDLMLEKIEQR